MKSNKSQISLNSRFNIPIAKTCLTNDDLNAVTKPIKSGWLVQGKNVIDFERKWSEFTGVSNSIAVTSCTAGLYVSLSALGFSKDDEAIVPAFTWISSANVVEHLGGKVVFCDIDIDDFNIDISKIEQCITSKTKAIIVVHLFGFPACMKEIIEIAKKFNLLVIEDAACGFGTYYDNKHVGNFGHTGCFSFHPRKSITTGEGGIITTNDNKLAEKLRILRDHGTNKSDFQRHHGSKPYELPDFTEAGYNFRMTDFQGALGSSQMDRASDILNERVYLAKRYNNAFKNLNWLRIPNNIKNGHGFQSYPCLLEKENLNKNNIIHINKKRNILMEHLQNKGISTRPATHAVHMLSYYKNKYKLKSQDYINSYFSYLCSLSLPLFNGLKIEEQDYVIDTILKYNY